MCAPVSGESEVSSRETAVMNLHLWPPRLRKRVLSPFPTVDGPGLSPPSLLLVSTVRYSGRPVPRYFT